MTLLYGPKISVICFISSKIFTCNDNVAGNIMDNGLLRPEQVCHTCNIIYNKYVVMFDGDLLIN